MSQDKPMSQVLNRNAAPFIPKNRIVQAVPTAPAIVNPGLPPQRITPQYLPPYGYPGMNYYANYQNPEEYDDYYEEEHKAHDHKEHKDNEHKKAKKDKKKQEEKKEKKTEVKKPPAKKEAKKEKKKEPPKEEIKHELKETKKKEVEKDDDYEDLPAEYVAVDEKRQPLSIVFIGHVDVGKSTICGQIMLVTGRIDPRTVKKYEQEAREKNRDSWWLAYIMDFNEEERIKGKTVEVGRATFVTETKRYTIYDAPGHLNYVPNMIMGACMSDIGALVISSKKGEFESGHEGGGQTLEHMLLAKSLGIQRLVMVINKMDEPSVKWSKERYEEIKESLTPYLKQYGFNPEKYVSWVPVSGLKNQNIIEKVDPKICSWYTGPTLMEILETIEVPERDDKGSLRVPILDRMKGRATDIFGKVNTGRIDVGAHITVMPYKLPAEVASIRNTDDQLVKYAKAGENIKLTLKGFENDDYIHKGCVLCGQADLCSVFEKFIADIKIVNMLAHKPVISNGYQCVLHLHTIAEECTIEKILGIKTPNDKEFKTARFARKGDQINAIISVKTTIAAEKYTTSRQLGRFTLRDEGKTVAIGTVQKYTPIKEVAKF